jgi:hypothetical protein
MRAAIPNRQKQLVLQEPGQQLGAKKCRRLVELDFVCGEQALTFNEDFLTTRL